MNYETVKEVFEKALEVPREEREQFVIAYAKSDSDLIEEVQSLLACSHPEDSTEFSYEPMIGKKVGDYIVIQRIGSGGMGRVYEAKNSQTGECVALKVLRKQFLGSNASKRFEQEVRVLRAIDHSGVAKIESAGMVEVDGSKLPWVAMELLEGSVLITEYAIDKSIDEKLQLLHDVCVAIDEAHRHGVIHRDLNPNNILVNPEGVPKIIDFGIAKVLDEELKATGLHTQASGFLGTPQYMAPEQFSESSAETTATDVFSLGVIMYEVLSGKHPFVGDEKSIPKTMLSITSNEPTPLESMNPSFRGDISAVVLKALTKDPRKRYASANEFADDLQNIIEGDPVSAKPEAILSQFVRKHRFVAALLAIITPLLAAATAVSVYYAIDANHQLQRNEKLLQFASEHSLVPREIIEQHQGYWQMYVQSATEYAKELSVDDPMLRADLFSLLGSKDTISVLGIDEASTLYTNAAIAATEVYGADSAPTLLLEAKSIDTNFKSTNPIAVQQLQAILDRWVDGTPLMQAQLLLLVAAAELDSDAQNTRQMGQTHAIQAEVLAEGANEPSLSLKSKRLRAWSFIVKDRDMHSLHEGIELLRVYVIPELESQNTKNRMQIIKAKSLLAIALFSRSELREKNQQIKDLQEAIELNQHVMGELIDNTGDGYNAAWQIMHNQARMLVAKSNWMTENVPKNKNEIIRLQQQAASLWQRVLHQSHLRDPDHNSNEEFYLPEFREALPEYAPTEVEWETFLANTKLLPIGDLRGK